MFTSLTSNAASVSSRPQLWFPEQRVGTQEKSQVQKPIARQLEPALSSKPSRIVKTPAGDAFQSSVPASVKPKASHQLTEESTPDDIPTKAFVKLGSSVGTVFDIQF